MIRRTSERSTTRKYAKVDISRSIVHEPRFSGLFDVDRRTRKTKDALRKALFSLIAEKGYDQVTVQNVLERADVGRSTFYTHFTDKHDAFRSGFDMLCDVLQQRLRSKGACMQPFSFSLEIYRYLHEPGMRALYAAIKDHPSGTIAMQWLGNLVTQLVRLDLPRLSSAPKNVPAEALEQFVVGTYLGLLTWSLSSSQTRSPEQLDEIFRTLVLPPLPA